MTDNDNLIERVKAALENLGDEPWLPDLTNDLAESGWRALYQQTGLLPADYGTSRVVAKSAHAPRNLLGHLSTSSAVEILDESLTSYYKDAGVEFYTAKEITDANLISRVEDAMNLIKRVPTLHTTVAALVKSIHLIKPSDDDYDVSFSEPHIPFSIFVSAPRQQNSITSLRIAEAVVHEAIHLQLTLVESFVALVHSTEGSYFSPWRGAYRTAHGVIHALYVFQVIARLLERLLSNNRYLPERVEHIQERRAEISEQVGEIESLRDCPELTATGARFVHQLVLM